MTKTELLSIMAASIVAARIQTGFGATDFYIRDAVQSAMEIVAEAEKQSPETPAPLAKTVADLKLNNDDSV